MPYLTTQETANFLGIDVRTLERWREKNTSPPYIKQGRVIRYDLEDLKEWIEFHKTV